MIGIRSSSEADPLFHLALRFPGRLPLLAKELRYGITTRTSDLPTGTIDSAAFLDLSSKPNLSVAGSNDKANRYRCQSIPKVVHGVFSRLRLLSLHVALGRGIKLDLIVAYSLAIFLRRLHAQFGKQHSLLVVDDVQKSVSQLLW